MTENKQTEAPKKKMTLQEAVKQQLANKKNKAAGGNSAMSGSNSSKKMSSQITQKPSNTRRKMGV